jgi:hypothetical protein
MVAMGARGARQAAKPWLISGCAALVTALVWQTTTAAPSAEEREQDKPRETKVVPVACEGTVVEFQPKYEFCDYPLVPEGVPHSIGVYPRFVIKLRAPKSHAGRLVTIILRHAGFENRSGSKTNLVGKPCSLELPADFLAGKFTTFHGWPDPRLTVHAPKPAR